MYQLLDLCDRYAVAQLYTVLGVGGKQIFQALHNDFKTFHKYDVKASS